MGIRDFIREISPGFLVGNGTPNTPLPQGAGKSERFMYAFGLCLDMLLERVNQAVLMRFPGMGDPSGLPYIGDDRQIVRGINEDDDNYATRLRRWLDTWRRAGSARGVIESVSGYVGVLPKIFSVLEGVGQSVYDVVEENDDPTEAPTTTRVDPPNWTFDLLGYFKRRWLVIRDKNDTTGEAWATSTRKWGDGLVWGDPSVSWGFDEPKETFESLRDIVSTWKAAATRYWWIIVNFDANNFDPSAAPGAANNPDPLFGEWSKIEENGHDCVRVPARFETARYIEGVRS